MYKLLDTIHANQTSTFLITLQQGYWYIKVGIHLYANYIFCELMKNRTKGEMITAYQRMVDRMNLLALGLKHHQLDNKCLANIQRMHCKERDDSQVSPPGLPPLQHCQTGNPNIQRPFCLHPQQSQL
jgi:hypothetical protein